MERVRTRLAQLEEISGFDPALIAGAVLFAIVGPSAATYVWGVPALAVVIAVLSVMLAIAAWSKLTRLHHEHRALLEVVTDLAAVATRTQQSTTPSADTIPTDSETTAEPAPAAPSEPLPLSAGSAVEAEAEAIIVQPAPDTDEAALTETEPVAEAFTVETAEYEYDSSVIYGPSLAELIVPDMDMDTAEFTDEHLPQLAEVLPMSALPIEDSDESNVRENSTSPGLFAQLAHAAEPLEHDEPTEDTSEALYDGADSAPMVASDEIAHEPVDSVETHQVEETIIPTPSFTLPTLDGHTIDQTVFAGRPTVLVFWRPGCPHSEGLTPDLIALQSELTDQGPQMVIVAACEASGVAAQGFGPTVLLDPTFSLGQAMGVGGTPAAVLLGPDGHPFGQIAAGANAVLGLLRAACRAWAALTAESDTATVAATDAESGTEATWSALGPNPFEHLAESMPFRPVIVKRRTDKTPSLAALDPDWDDEEPAHLQAG